MNDIARRARVRMLLLAAALLNRLAIPGLTMAASANDLADALRARARALLDLGQPGQGASSPGR